MHEASPHPAEPETFVRAHTVPETPALLPELTLHLSSRITPIWQATEEWLAARNIPPPYWAFAWPGGQALARYILDHPATIRGRRVLDFAAGCGVAAIAGARVGAIAEAAEIDPLAIAAIRLNAATNNASIAVLTGDIIGAECRWDIILAGDVCYEAPMTARMMPWLRHMAASAEVWIADPGRAYLPTAELTAFARYTVPTTLELEDRTEREVTLYRLEPDRPPRTDANPPPNG